MQLSEPQEAEVQVHPLLLHIPLQRVVSVVIVPGLLLASDEFFADCTCPTILVERIATHCCRVSVNNAAVRNSLRFQPTPNTSSKISERYLVNNDSNYHACV